MQFGFFDDHRREYVITSPRTPLPWINYLGSEDFFALVSNTAGGYCFYRDARLRRLTRYRYNNCPLRRGSISTSKTAIPSGTPDGSLRKRSWTAIPAATASATA